MSLDLLPTYEDGVEVWNLSPSQMSMYKNCARSWELYYVDGIGKERSTKSFFEIGNYFHELMHVYYHVIREGQTPGSEFVLNYMMSRMRRDFENITDEKQIHTISIVTRLVSDYVSRWSPILDKGIIVEGVENKLKVPVKTPGGNEVVLHCITDLLYRTSNGKLTTRDHKTGQANSWHQSMLPLENQLLFNSAAYYLKTGEMPLRVEISYINSYDYKTKIPSLKERFQNFVYTHNEQSILNYIQEIYKFIDTTIETKHFARSYSKDCSRCQFNGICTEEIRGLSIEPIIRSQYSRIERDYEVRLKHKSAVPQQTIKSSAGDKESFSLSLNL